MGGYKKMNILVLGSEGLIGKPLCTYLAKHGHKIFCIDKVFGPDHDLAELEGYTLLKDMLIRQDENKIDKVIFLAFNVGGSKYLENNDNTFEYINENVKIMTNVFRLLKWSKVPFLFASSQMSNMYHTNYGLLKQLGERYIRSIDNGWICRFWNVYGPEEYGEKSHVITDFIKQVRENGQIKMRTDGHELRQFIYVDDVSRAIETWIDGKWDDRNQNYDITSFDWSSIYYMARKVYYMFGLDGAKVICGDKVDTIQNKVNEPDKYILKFWMPQISLEEGLERLLSNEK